MGSVVREDRWMARWLTLALLLTACANHARDPHGCRERVALALADVYTQPADLGAAIDTVCGAEP
jgi:hypothetical protein